MTIKLSINEKIETIIQMNSGEECALARAYLIKRLTVDHLRIIEDVLSAGRIRIKSWNNEIC